MNYKLTQTEAVAAVTALIDCGAFNSPAMRYALKFVSVTGVIPEWLTNYQPGKWYVRDGSRTIETTATSERDAINHVRWRFYGETPEAECGPFFAVCPYEVVMAAKRAVAIAEGRAVDESTHDEDLFGRRKLTKAEALRRIRNMRMRKAS